MEIYNLITILISSGALVFSFLNYKRGNKIDNENFLFSTKVEAYGNILAEMKKMLHVLEDNIGEAAEFALDPNDENIEILDEQADEVDKLCHDFNDFIISKSIIIPKEILKSLSKFCDEVLDTETLDSETKNIKQEIQRIEKIIDKLVDDADKISEMLRKDLHIDALNSSLYKRLKK